MRSIGLCLTALPLFLALPTAAAAQDAAANAQPAAEAMIDFSADQVIYDSDAEIITADGQVRMSRDGNYLAADRVSWNRKSGQVIAEGNVVVVNPEGDKLIGDRIDLTESLRDGTIENLLIVMESGSRIAAVRGSRTGTQTVLENAVYSPCPVTSETGCPRDPSWKITAARVTQDSTTGRIRFTSGRLTILGLTIPLLPIFSIGDGSQGRGGFSGALVPGIRIDSNNGVEINLPYYWRVDRNRDLTMTPHIYSGVLPALEARWRHLTSIGAYQLGGFVTYGNIPDSDAIDLTPENRRGFRGYFEGNGRFQLDPYWTVTSSFRVATDKTVTRRYDITRDDRLRNFINAERIDLDSYISIEGWAFQGLRSTDEQERIPYALPAVDARLRVDDVLGGRIELQANSLSIARSEGQDTQRAFAGARWDLRRLTGLGQLFTLTAYARGDAYHSDESAETAVDIYRGKDGWQFRGIAALAAELQWPLVGELWGGTQRLTPRLQLVLTPGTKNLDIPNEDARSVDLEDSNLFALNRFPGYDRWEDGSRVTYGLEWSLDRPKWSTHTVIGQSYRLTREPSMFPDGTGLTDRFSDIVGRTRVRFGRLFDITNRFRLDKDNLAIRRTELDLTVGTDRTYAQVGYLRLNRDISSDVEDLRDKEELRLAGRLQFHRYWSVFGSTVIDLTDAKEDPLSLADGFEAVRHRLGFNYEDECLLLGVAWKRDYERVGEFKSSSTFSINFSLKGIGR